jgi:hypothetical protein
MTRLHPNLEDEDVLPTIKISFGNGFQNTSQNLEMLFLISILCNILLLNTILAYNTQILFQHFRCEINVVSKDSNICYYGEYVIMAFEIFKCLNDNSRGSLE